MRLLSLLFLSVFFIQPASARDLHVKYDVSLMGLKIGDGNLSIGLQDKKYTISGAGEMAAFGSIVSDGRGEVRSSGELLPESLKPTAFHMRTEEDGKPSNVSLKLQKGEVTDQTVHPPQDRLNERIQVTKDHKRGVIDPLSAILFTAPNGLGPEICDRTIEIYDGRDRYDIVMSYKSRYQKKAGKKRYSGSVLACSARYKPISGHRPNRKTIQQLAANKTLEIHLAEIPGTSLLLLYRSSLMTPVGKAVIQNVKYQFSN